MKMVHRSKVVLTPGEEMAAMADREFIAHARAVLPDLVDEKKIARDTTLGYSHESLPTAAQLQEMRDLLPENFEVVSHKLEINAPGTMVVEEVPVVWDILKCPGCGCEPRAGHGLTKEDPCPGREATPEMLKHTPMPTDAEFQAVFNPPSVDTLLVGTRTLKVEEVSSDLLEALAAYSHGAWANWMKYQKTKSYDASNLGTVPGEWTILKDSVDRWERQMNTPYAELPEEEKKSDRDEARKILAIIQQYLGTSR
jgi:hypothetical protein